MLKFHKVMRLASQLSAEGEQVKSCYRCLSDFAGGTEDIIQLGHGFGTRRSQNIQYSMSKFGATTENVVMEKSMKRKTGDFIPTSPAHSTLTQPCDGKSAVSTNPENQAQT